jgi:hypothetical protein
MLSGAVVANLARQLILFYLTTTTIYGYLLGYTQWDFFLKLRNISGCITLS